MMDAPSYRFGLVALLVASVCGSLALQAQTRRPGARPTPAPAAQSAQADEKAASGGSKPLGAELAIRAAADDYVKAFNARDFQAIGQQWTEQAELHTDNGNVVRGRDAIVALIKAAGNHRPKAKISINIDSVVLLGASAGRVHGTLHLKDEGEVGSWATRFSSLRVLESGQWRLAESRETSIATAAIDDLAWLVGTWKAEGPAADLTVRYEKALGNKGLIGKISGKSPAGDFEVVEVIQLRDGELRTWIFDSSGLSGEGFWEHDGARFNRTIHGTSADGAPASSVQVVTRTSSDSFLWSPIERMRGGSRLPDLAHVKFTRVK